MKYRFFVKLFSQAEGESKEEALQHLVERINNDKRELQNPYASFQVEKGMAEYEAIEIS